MNQPGLKKLILNQEFVRRLTTGEPRNLAGGLALSVPHVFCLTGFSCPECNPPGFKKE